MRQIVLMGETDWAGWRQATRSLVLNGIEPAAVQWTVGGAARSMAPPEDSGQLEGSGTFHVPRALVALAEQVIQARQPDRFGLMYSLVWRAHRGEKLLEDATDPDLRLARHLALAVRTDAHRMRTNLRFMPVADRRFLGWFEPLHYVLAGNAALMARRFPDLTFSIVTPDGAAHVAQGQVRIGTGLPRAEDDTALRAWWEAHGGALLADSVPLKDPPEAEAVDEAPRPPDRPALGPVVMHAQLDPDLLASAGEAAACTRCHLYAPATQTVFGEGPANARVLFVGEQPGDQEDVIGRPFVGPAGQMMDRAMEEAGIDRRAVYVTNAVKHFKFTPRGKRRIHQTPEAPEIKACAFWLDVERTRLRPDLTVLMGATAARAVLGRQVTISRERGRPFNLPDGRAVFVTVHPSFLLRVPDPEAKAREYAAFVRDLAAVRELVA
jgi:probable DNA metabolism protein